MNGFYYANLRVLGHSKCVTNFVGGFGTNYNISMVKITHLK